MSTDDELELDSPFMEARPSRRPASACAADGGMGRSRGAGKRRAKGVCDPVFASFGTRSRVVCIFATSLQHCVTFDCLLLPIPHFPIP